MPFSSSKDRRRSRWVVRPLRWAPDHQSVDENFSIFPECRLLLFSAWKDKFLTKNWLGHISGDFAAWSFGHLARQLNDTNYSWADFFIYIFSKSWTWRQP
jgi:hypothetical protein